MLRLKLSFVKLEAENNGSTQSSRQLYTRWTKTVFNGDATQLKNRKWWPIIALLKPFEEIIPQIDT